LHIARRLARAQAGQLVVVDPRRSRLGEVAAEVAPAGRVLVDEVAACGFDVAGEMAGDGLVEHPALGGRDGHRGGGSGLASLGAWGER